MKTWYSIRARASTPSASGEPLAKSAEVYIYGDIGESWWDETISARNFVRDVMALDVEELTVRINSIGGSVPDGIAIYNALRRHKAEVTVVIDGMAMSVASLIAMAGDRVQMAENAVLMIHAPWTYASGNARELRESADMLDTWASAMATSYAAKSGKSQDDALALLTDGRDHFFTAAEAASEGFVDEVVSAMPVAASASLRGAALARFPSAAVRIPDSTFPAAPAASKEDPMSDKQKPQATGPQPAPEPKSTELSPAEVLAADRARRDAVRAQFALAAKRFGGPELDALQRECEDDHSVDAPAAAARILQRLGQSAEPVAAHRVVTVEDEADKRREAIVAWLVTKAGHADARTRDAAMASPYRGQRLLDIARGSLDRIGVSHAGLDEQSVVRAAITQGTSDFPVLLENAMYKTLQQAYATAPDTWSRFCARGSVSDFRAHPRYRVGSLGNLDAKNELGEFQNKTIPDGEKASISVTTRGNIINVSREAIVNDDLGAFMGLSAMAGRAARRTIEAAVYSLLAQNSGAGPTMPDGQPLFHSTHGNVTTGAALTAAAIDLDRVAMAAQSDVSGNDFLDLRPAVLLVPLALGSTARVVNNAEYDPDANNKLQRPNSVRGLFRDIVDTPRLSGTRRYLFADPADAPVLEVAFLNGADAPFLEREDGFKVDGVMFKVRLDFGVAAIDWRGAVTNAGA